MTEMLSKHNNKDGINKIRHVVALLDPNSESSETSDSDSFDEETEENTEAPLAISNGNLRRSSRLSTETTNCAQPGIWFPDLNAQANNISS